MSALGEEKGENIAYDPQNTTCQFSLLHKFIAAAFHAHAQPSFFLSSSEQHADLFNRTHTPNLSLTRRVRPLCIANFVPRCMAAFEDELIERGKGWCLRHHLLHTSLSYSRFIPVILNIDNHEHLSPHRLAHRVHLPCQHLQNTVRQ